MMRTAAMGAVALFTSAALAAELPIKSSYGDAEGCRLYRLGGIEAVYGGGFGHGPVTEGGFVVAPDGVASLEWSCTISSVGKLDKDAREVRLACYGEGEERTHRAIVGVKDDTLGLIIADIGLIKSLSRCPDVSMPDFRINTDRGATAGSGGGGGRK